MFKIKDRIKENSITEGNPLKIVLNNTYGGFQSFASGIGHGNSTFYTIENNENYEIGIGTYSSGDNSISRDTILESTNNNSRINLLGVSVVFGTYPGTHAFFVNDQGIASGQSPYYSGGVVFPDGRVQNVAYQGSGEYGEILFWKADKHVFDSNHYLTWDEAVSTLNVSGIARLHSDVYISGNLEVAGTQTIVNTEINNSAVSGTTLTQSTFRIDDAAGCFFHAYVDNDDDKTVALYSTNELYPEWRLGLKDYSSSFVGAPNRGFIFADYDSVGGVASDLNNLYVLNTNNGFWVKHIGRDIMNVSRNNGLNFYNDSSIIVPLSIRAAAGQSVNLQDWKNYAGSVLASVSKDGQISVPSIKFPDGTTQSTANIGSLTIGSGTVNAIPKFLTSTSFTDSVLFESGGSIGINTSIPQAALDVNGIVIASGGNSAQWNTAYSWGDHSTQGYLTTINIPQSGTWNDTADLVSTSGDAWSEAYSWGDHSAAGYLTSGEFVHEASGCGLSVVNPSGHGLQFGECAYGAYGSSYNGDLYTGVTHTKLDSSQEYMLLSKGDHTFISAKDGYASIIRGGNNNQTYQLLVNNFMFSVGQYSEKMKFSTSKVEFNLNNENLDFAVHGSLDNLFYVDASQNTIGINTDTPTNRLLTIRGKSSPDNNAAVLLQGSGVGTTAYDGFLLSQSHDGTSYVWNFETKPLIFANDNTERMRLESDGKLSHYGMAATIADASDYELQIRGTGITLAGDRLRINSTETAINDSGVNVDFRVEGDAEENLLFVDASTDSIGIGTDNPGNNKFRIHHNTARYNSENTAHIKIQNSGSTIGGLIGADATDDVFYIQAVDPGSSWAKNIALQAMGGKVGVGTVNPSPAGGDTSIHIAATNYPELKLTNDTTGHGANSGTAIQVVSNSFVVTNRQKSSSIKFNAFDSVGVSKERLNLSPAVSVFNEDGENVDFRVEGNSNQDLLYVDASTDRVGIGTNSPTNWLDVHATGVHEGITIRGTNAPGLTLHDNGGPDVSYTGGGSKIVEQASSLHSGVLIIDADTNNVGHGSYMSLRVDGTERVQITEDGKLEHYGTEAKIADGSAYELDISASAATLGGNRFQLLGTETVFNQAGENYDFRIEGDADVNLFKTNASTDNVTIGAAPEFDYVKFLVYSYDKQYQQIISGGCSGVGLLNNSYINSGVTTATSFYSYMYPHSTTDTLNSLIHFRAGRPVTASTGPVTTERGFYADVSGATHNRGFQGIVPTGDNNYNLYMSSDAKNYLAGNLGVGTSTPAYTLDIAGSGRFTEPMDNHCGLVIASSGDVNGELHIGSCADSAGVGSAMGLKHSSMDGANDYMIMANTDGATFVSAKDTKTLTLSAGGHDADTKLELRDGSLGFRFNVNKSNVDLQYNGDNENNVFYIDASADSVGVGTDSPTQKLDINSSGIRIRDDHTPASASGVGNKGEIVWDSNYVYICVATNTWKRAALSTW